MRAVLVTGGAGFIGSHVCKALAAAGLRPVTLDNLRTGHRDAVRWGPFVEGDVRDACTVEETLRRYDVEAVLHFAAAAYVGESVDRPDFYYDNNVRGMLSLLQACTAAKIRKLVFSSSCATYGEPDRLPISEAAPQAPVNPYGRTKLIGEQMLRDLGGQHGMSHVILRYFNAAGADPDGDLCERHDPETHLIPLALLAARDKRTLKVFGSDYDTPDGTCIRDYIHVTDLAEGHVRALRHLAEEDVGAPAKSLAVNLGTGRGRSIREIVAAVETCTGSKVPLEFAPRRAGDPAALVADPALSRTCLGFSCQHSDLDRIVTTAARCFGLTTDPIARA